MNPRRSVAWIALAVCLVWSLAARAAGPEKRAAEMFQAGSDAYARGDFVGAARAFEQANTVAPRGPTMLNAARAWQQAHQRSEAADAFAAALKLGGLSASEEKLAHTQLQALERELGRLRITSPDAAFVSVAHIESAPTPLSVHLAPGRYVVRFSWSDGSKQQMPATATAGETTTLAVHKPAKPVARATKPRAKPAAPPSPPRSTAHLWLGGAALGTGAILGGVSVYMGEEALKARDDFRKSGGYDASAHDRAASLRLWTNVLAAGAIVGGATGVVLILTHGPDPAPPSDALVLSPGYASWTHRF